MVPAEKNYHVTEQELLAVIEALRAFRCYVDGVHFNLITDHKPNTYLDTQPNMSRRQTRWSEYLQRFNFTWEYRPDVTNVADPLSRNPSYRPIPSLLLHALHAQLNVSTRARTAPAREAAKAAESGPALQSPATLPNPNSYVTPSVFATQSVPPSPASFVDTVAEDTAAEVAAGPVLDLHAELMQGYELDPWFATADNRQDLQLLDGLSWKGDRIAVPHVASLRSALI